MFNYKYLLTIFKSIKDIGHAVRTYPRSTYDD